MSSGSFRSGFILNPEKYGWHNTENCLRELAFNTIKVNMTVQFYSKFEEIDSKRSEWPFFMSENATWDELKFATVGRLRYSDDVIFDPKEYFIMVGFIPPNNLTLTVW